MNTIKEIEQFKKHNLFLVPLKEDKRPKSKPDVNGKWSWKFKNKKTKELIEWSDQELLNAKGLGVSHQHCNVIDVDFDNPTAQLFHKCYPSTFSLGKKDVTHLLYKVDKFYKSYSYPKSTRNGKVQKGGAVIELLTNTQTVLKHSDGTRKIFKDIEPKKVEYANILNHVKLTALFSELFKIWPKSGLEMRDKAWLRLMGAFVKHTNVPHDLILKFSKRFCEITGDKEIDNRLNKLQYCFDTHKEDPKQVYGIDALAKFLNANIPAFDEIKIETEESTDVQEEEEFDDEQHYPVLNFWDMLNTNYPEPKFLLEPIIREKTVNQISGDYGAGKTHLGLRLAMSLCSGLDFLKWKNRSAARPVLYVEGELPASDIKDRINTMSENIDPIEDLNKENRTPKFDVRNLFILTLDDLDLHGYKYGFESLAVTNNEDGAARGRVLIENTCDKIKERTGKYPVLFLDNISALTSIDENKAQDWSSLVQWFMKLKTKGIVIIFFHHLGKTTRTASGSNLAQRLIDNHFILEKLPPKCKFEMNGKNVQCSLYFDKHRNFGGQDADQIILTCSEQGEWKLYPMLDQKDFLILGYHNQGMTVEQMLKEDKSLSQSTVYRKLEFMKKRGVIK